MKLILILTSLLLLLLVSCTQYRYDVTYEKCNGQTGSIVYFNDGYVWRPHISERKLNTLGGEIYDVCSFSYTREEIK